MLNILRSGKLSLALAKGIESEQPHSAGKNYFASFTRSRFGGYHWGEDGSSSIYSNTEVLITVNGNLLSEKYKFVPVDFFKSRGEILDENDRYSNAKKEVEERLVSNKPEIDFLKAITKVDFIQKSVQGEVVKWGSDAGKFKIIENKKHKELLGSLILQLKLLKIPYNFYDSVKDWTKKLSYSYIGKKDVEKSKIKESSNYDKSEYKQMTVLLECLNDTKYSNMSEEAKHYADEIHRNTDNENIIYIVGRNSKPNSEPALRNLALKLSRIINSKFNFGAIHKLAQNISDFISNKVSSYYGAELGSKKNRLGAYNAKSFILALTTPIASWDKDNLVLSEISEIDGRHSFAYENTETLFDDTLNTKSEEVEELKSILRKLKVKDLTAYIAREVVPVRIRKYA